MIVPLSMESILRACHQLRHWGSRAASERTCLLEFIAWMGRQTCKHIITAWGHDRDEGFDGTLRGPESGRAYWRMEKVSWS